MGPLNVGRHHSKILFKSCLQFQNSPSYIYFCGAYSLWKSDLFLSSRLYRIASLNISTGHQTVSGKKWGFVRQLKTSTHLISIGLCCSGFSWYEHNKQFTYVYFLFSYPFQVLLWKHFKCPYIAIKTKKKRNHRRHFKLLK